MKLGIVGKPYGSGVSHDVIRSSMKFFETLIAPLEKELMKNVKIEVRIIPNIFDIHKTTGFSAIVDDKIRPNNFLLEIDDSIIHKSTLITLAHEFTHINQFVSGKRRMSPDGDSHNCWWMGTLVDPSTLHYYDYPWEIDAHGREYGMYQRYVDTQVLIQSKNNSNVA